MITNSDQEVAERSARLPEVQNTAPPSSGWRVNLDLIGLILLSLAMPGVVLLDTPFVRLPVALVLVLLAPGYALTETLLPARREMDRLARFGLSFGLSVVAVAILAPLLTVSPWGFRFWPAILSLAGWNVAFSLLALRRRTRLGPAGRPETLFMTRQTFWLAGLGGAVLIVALVYVISVLTTPDPTTRLTEFYAFSSTGLVEDYPTEVAHDQPITFRLGIANHEGQIAHYRIEVKTGIRVLKTVDGIDLPEGGKWEQPLQFSLSRPGNDQLIDVLLYYNGSATPYRSLRLWVNVT